MSSSKQFEAKGGATLSRRTLVGAVGVTAATLAAGKAFAQATPTPVGPPSTITTPPRDFGRGGAPTTYFTDPDILSVDPSFNALAQPNSAIQRLWTGALWSEGPAWNAQGRYLVWSDIPNNRQLRWLEDDGRVSVFRSPSNNSNGNTFDFQGRQLSCEHLTRRVVRYELDGSVTVLADAFNGKRLNSPNDVVPHPDGSYWFTDPPYGGQLYEGAPMSPADRAMQPASSTRGSARRPASASPSASCRPIAIASIPAGGRSRGHRGAGARIPTGSASRPTTRSSTSSAPARDRATPGRAARARSIPSTSAPTTRSPTASCSATS